MSALLITGAQNSRAQPPDALLMPEEQLADKTLEARAVALGRRIRCQTCQFQNINESTAPSAQTLRRIIRKQLTAGNSDSFIINDLVSRYGTSILLSPPVAPHTLVLWLLPLGLLGTALLLWLKLR